jgi:hypothetical protein
MCDETQLGSCHASRQPGQKRLPTINVDKDLLALGKFQGIAMIEPGEFWGT